MYLYFFNIHEKFEIIFFIISYYMNTTLRIIFNIKNRYFYDFYLCYICRLNVVKCRLKTLKYFNVMNVNIINFYFLID